MRMQMVWCALFLVASVAQSQDRSARFYETKYDTAANPFSQLDQARQRAHSEGKHILLDVGGEWCIWCHRLDDFFKSNEDLADLLLSNYVPVKINFSMANKNEEFLGQFPKIEGYPHLFVLDDDGKLLHSQNTGELEENKSYSHEKMQTFLEAWTDVQ